MRCLPFGECSAAALPDSTFNLRMDKASDTTLALSIVGNSRYTAGATVELSGGIMSRISYAGLLTKRSTVRFTDFRIGNTSIMWDYSILAKEAIDNLMKNFLDSENNRLKPVRNGFVNRAVTNTGKIVTVTDAGEVWESTVMLMALDTYAQTLDLDSEEYRNSAHIIVNTIDMLLDQYPEEQITQAAIAPNYAMDDTGWTTMCLLLGYHYNRGHCKSGSIHGSPPMFSAKSSPIIPRHCRG